MVLERMGAEGALAEAGPAFARLEQEVARFQDELASMGWP
jgi:hypothetical protein